MIPSAPQVAPAHAISSSRTRAQLAPARVGPANSRHGFLLFLCASMRRDVALCQARVGFLLWFSRPGQAYNNRAPPHSIYPGTRHTKLARRLDAASKWCTDTHTASASPAPVITPAATRKITYDLAELRTR
ncbi:hypothetical protein PYCCODRAFT_760545 [Trametes coccinea BRFM310]|uniref:Uncharacterized protein n=1 Tax=Trametes coccinea (strain BRFM310) TaxID=1353009 RepID=A0A1Y2J024_TRAC3|nr:hypothetical protein PYCCODRAFT_760545 [Trametes coccinea BRFM310]